MKTTDQSVAKRKEICEAIAAMMQEKDISYNKLEKLTQIKASNIKRVTSNEYSTSIDILLIIGRELGYELGWKKIED